MNVNSEIKIRLQNRNIGINDGLAYLLCLYHNLEPSYIPEDLKRRVLMTGIVALDNNSIKWNYPLFEESETEFEWVKEIMVLFGEVNKARKGTKGTVLRKMKKFFAENSSVRKEEVLNATKLYLSEVNDSTYCMKSQNFIELNGESVLLGYIERIREDREITTKFDNFI